MSTIKSSAENLTLNADGANNDIIFQSNGSNVATLDQAGLLTATTFAGSGASLTGVNAVNTGRKNLIINGDMMIDQRNAGASATTSSSVYMADRFQLYASTINNAQTYQVVVDAPAGFNKSLKITNSSTAQAAGSNALFTPRQRIEGYDIAHLNWGTSDAQTVTISFWVKASVTGTYPLAISNGGFNRSFVTNYTVSVANTWEKKTATIAGDTSGTWAVDNTTGMIIMFSLDAYADYQTSTVDSWQSSNDRATSSHIHFLATASATWQITGVQVELGSTATDFEHRSYGEELAVCERYFQTYVAGEQEWIYCEGTQATHKWWQVSYRGMRAAPTFSASSAYTGVSSGNVGGGDVVSLSGTPSLNRVSVRVTMTNTSGTAHGIHHIDAWANDSCYFDAEL